MKLNVKRLGLPVLVCLISIGAYAQPTLTPGDPYMSGPSTVPCGGSGAYSLSVPGGGYVVSASWSVSFSTGGGSGSGSGQNYFVQFPQSPGSATITATVVYYKPCKPPKEGEPIDTDCGFKEKTVKAFTSYGPVTPATPAYISGPTTVCSPNSTQTYSVPAVANASQYVWSTSFPYYLVHPISGALVSSYTGPQTSMQVRFPGSGGTSQNINVYAISNTGSCAASGGTRSLTVQYGAQSSAISGPSIANPYTSYTFSLTGTGNSNFYWSYPNGWNATSGVTYSFLDVIPSTTSGYISVSYNNCGGSTSASKYVTVNSGLGFRGGEVEGLGDIALEKVTLYPNPAKDIITLNSESPIQSIKIVDLTGREVKSVSGTDNLTVKVDVRDLEPGNYLVVSTGEQRQHVHQLVIQ